MKRQKKKVMVRNYVIKRHARNLCLDFFIIITIISDGGISTII